MYLFFSFFGADNQKIIITMIIKTIIRKMSKIITYVVTRRNIPD